MAVHDGAGHCEECGRVILRDSIHIGTGRKECCELRRVGPGEYQGGGGGTATGPYKGSNGRGSGTAG